MNTEGVNYLKNKNKMACENCGIETRHKYCQVCQADVDDDERQGGACECPGCGANINDGEECELDCPYNDTPFAMLIKEGYD